jgi:hypothetical protein
VLLASLHRQWRRALLLVKPDTVLRWHREGFRLYWRRKSRSGGPRKPRLVRDVVALIRRMATQNRLWGAELYVRPMTFDTRVLGAMFRLGRYRRAADDEPVALRVGGPAIATRAAMRRLAHAGLVDLRRGHPARLTMAGLALAVAEVRSRATLANLRVDASRAA